MGSEGHLLTNNHCIGSAFEAQNTNYEFLAEGANCATDCTDPFACPGTVVATSATLVKTNSTLDYSLVRLPTDPTGIYGFLQLRGLGASINERIYIAGHPATWGKRISFESDNPNDQSGFCEAFDFSGHRLRYFCDTQGGSSGSPVIGHPDHAVVALHSHGGCPNSGTASQRLITDLGAGLPPNSVAGPGSCVPSSTALCLQNNRFRAQVSVNGTPGKAIPYSNDGGYFWAFSAPNVEVGVKVLDGQPLNGNWWVFHGSLTTTPYTLTVTDTLVGTVKTYNKPVNTMCGGVDFGAFQGFAAPVAGLVAALPADTGEAAGAPEGACSPSATAVCLLNDRFRVQVKRSGVAQRAVEVTSQTGSFWFFTSQNPEVAVKVLDGTAVNGKHWVFFGSMTDQSYQVSVTDTSTGAVQTYNSPAPHCGAFDTSAF